MTMKRCILLICTCALLTPIFSLSCYANSPIKRIALTFDDGPHPRQTAQIMDVLDKYDIKATFFVIGINVKTYPGIVGEELKRGHEVGNHTYTHPHAANLGREALEAQILDCEKAVFSQTGQAIHLFRPPEGAINSELRQAIHENGYTNVLWTLDTRDWAHTPPEQIAAMITENAKNSDIILMHDYIGANSPTVKALELFIPILLEQGFTFVTISELLKYR